MAAYPEMFLQVPDNAWMVSCHWGCHPCACVKFWCVPSQGEAFFPHDFPDTAAYAALQAELCAELEAQRSARPKGRHPGGPPHPPAWELVGSLVPAASDRLFGNIPEPAKDRTGAPAGEPDGRAAGLADRDQPEAAAAKGAESGAFQAMGEVPDVEVSLGKQDRSAEGREAATGSERTPEPEVPAQPEPMLVEAASAAAEEPKEDRVPTSIPGASSKDTAAKPSLPQTAAHVVSQSGTAAPPDAGQTAEMELDSPGDRCQDMSIPAVSAQQAAEAAAGDELHHSSAPVQCAVARSQHVLHSKSIEIMKGARCMVEASLHPIGPGVLHEGAAILALSADEAQTIRRCMLGHKLPPKVGMAPVMATVLGSVQVLVPHVCQGCKCEAVHALQDIHFTLSGACMHAVLCPWKFWSSVPDTRRLLQGAASEASLKRVTLKDALKLFLEAQSPQKSSAGSEQIEQATLNQLQAEPVQGAQEQQDMAEGSSRLLAGFVTSEAPRGLLGRGARAVCLEPLLRSLRAQQAPAKETGGVLVAYRNPLSPVLRIAEAQINYSFY